MEYIALSLPIHLLTDTLGDSGRLLQKYSAVFVVVVEDSLVCCDCKTCFRKITNSYCINLYF